MNISKEKHSFIINTFLFLIASTQIFRLPCTVIMICFSFYSLLFYNLMSFPKGALKYVLIIAIPLLLEIIYFWNNDDFYLGIKSLEKYISLLLFPIFIIGNKKNIKLYSLLKAYSVATTLILLLFLIRYYFVYQEFFLIFYYGMNIWQMGYHFANTIGIHAPALNMHLAFVSICNFYFSISIFKIKKHFLLKILHTLLFVLSFILILIINTRIALLVSFIGYFLVITFFFLKNKNIHHLIKITSIFIIIISVILIVFIKNNHFMEQKLYREQNSIIIAEKQKLYREQNKDILAKKQSIAYQANKVIIAEKQKLYREQNKVEINQRRKEHRLAKKLLSVVSL